MCRKGRGDAFFVAGAGVGCSPDRGFPLVVDAVVVVIVALVLPQNIGGVKLASRLFRRTKRVGGGGGGSTQTPNEQQRVCPKHGSTFVKACSDEIVLEQGFLFAVPPLFSVLPVPRVCLLFSIGWDERGERRG